MSEKIKDNLRVFVVPVDIFDVAGLSIYEKMVYIVLRSFVNPRELTAFPSYKTIARLSGMSVRKAHDAMDKLISVGLVTKENRFEVSRNRKIRQTSNIYKLENPNIDRDGVHHMHGGGAPHAPGGVHHMHGGGAPHAYQEQYQLTNPNIKEEEYIKAIEKNIFVRTFFEEAKDRLPEDIILETAMYINKEKIEYNYQVLIETIEMCKKSYINGEIKYFPAYFAKVLQDQQNRKNLKVTEDNFPRFGQFNWLEK